MQCTKNVIVADSKLVVNWLTTSMVQIFTCTNFCSFVKKCLKCAKISMTLNDTVSASKFVANQKIISIDLS